MDCLDEDTVAELIEGRLSSAARADVEAHLDGCEACRGLVGAVARGAQDEPERPWARAALPRGVTFGRYVILALVGGGGMGVVYAAYDPELDRKIALKFLRPSDDPSSEPRARMQREARAMARLQHPNVVAVHDVGDDGEEMYVAMEFVDGQTLSRWLQREPRGWRQIVEVFLGAGRGLAAAHAAGLVHRDFKPSNVLLDKDGRVRVTDFGLARASGGREQSGATPGDRDGAIWATRTGHLVGTPAYMAPEQFAGGAVDARSDVFGFCVALHEALYGARPFAGVTLEEVRAAALRGRLEPAPPRPRVPPRIRRILERGLRPSADERYQSMDALLADLARDPRRALRRALIGAVLAALIVGLFAAVMREDPGAACRGADAKLHGIWDRERKQAIVAAFRATGRREAAADWAATERALDAYAEQWVARYTEVCEEARVRREISEEELDLRFECLITRLQDLRHLTHGFLGADARVVAGAPGAADGLPDLGTCLDSATLRARHSASCAVAMAGTGPCEPRIETLSISRIAPGLTTVVAVAIGAQPHLVGYDSATGAGYVLSVHPDGSTVLVARAPWHAGWTQIVPLGDGQIVAYSALSGAATVGRIDAASRLTTSREQAVAVGMTLVARLGEDRLLFYRRETGEALWVALHSDGILERLRGESWVPGWTTITLYRTDAGWQCMAYDATSGTVHFYTLDGEYRRALVRSASWTAGWTAFLPFRANTAPHYVAYKVGSGRTAVERLDVNGSEETLVDTRRSVRRTQLGLFEMKRHPHYFSYDGETGELSIDRIDL